MITIKVPEKELFDEKTESFHTIKACELHLEHSLISLSRWESKWKKPYIDDVEHSRKEIIDYICCMSVDKVIDPEVIETLDMDTFKKILEYIGDSNTATTIVDRRPNKGPSREKVTSELIYYWMIYYGIPFECQKWHLNRLMTLIRVCGIKGGTTNQDMDLNSIFAQNRKLNAHRRAAR